jgi:PilZ domain
MTAIPDRRTCQRFPLRLPVRYRPTGAPASSNWAVSESVNISSGGLLFTTSEAVTPGEAIEAFLAWPVVLDNRIKLKLGIKGHVVRCDGNHTAMRLESYEFKTYQTPFDATSRGL